MFSSRKAGLAVAGAAALGTCVYLYLQSGKGGDASSKKESNVKTNGVSSGTKTTVETTPSPPVIQQEDSAAAVSNVDLKSESFDVLPQSTKQTVEPRKSAMIDDLSDSWEKVVGKATTDSSTPGTIAASSPREEQSMYTSVESAESFDTMDEENMINLRTDAATVAKMRSAAAMKKKKGKKTTSTAAEVAKKEMQSAPAAAKKKKKKIR